MQLDLWIRFSRMTSMVAAVIIATGCMGEIQESTPTGRSTTTPTGASGTTEGADGEDDEEARQTAVAVIRAARLIREGRPPEDPTLVKALEDAVTGALLPACELYDITSGPANTSVKTLLDEACKRLRSAARSHTLGLVDAEYASLAQDEARRAARFARGALKLLDDE